MLAAWTQEYRTSHPCCIPAKHLLLGEGSASSVDCAREEIADNLNGWAEQDNHPDVAGRFYEIGQIGFS